MFIDTHCHLDFPQFDRDRDEVISRANKEGVESIINIGSCLEGSQRSLELSQKYGCVYAAVGIHPHEADKSGKKEEDAVRGLAKSKKVVAVGEIGLDYFKNFSKAQNQKPLFISLIKIAKDLGLPLVIHSREASIDTVKILKDSMPVKAVVHCFSGDESFLRQCLDLGFYVSFTCNITYPKAQGLREVVKLTPLERIFLETDAPFLAPQQLRGKRNEPMNVRPLAAEIGRIKGIEIEEAAAKTTENAKGFFGLK